MFTNAYGMLKPAEKHFVDGYVSTAEREAYAKRERLTVALDRPISDAAIAASRGMLDRPMVRAAIAERISELARDAELNVQRVLKEIMATAFSNLGDYMVVGEDGSPWFDLSKATPEQLSAIKSIKVKETGSPMERSHKREFEFTLHDKLTAIGMLARFMGMLESDNPHFKADQSRNAQAPTLANNASEQDAGELYAQMING